MPRQYRLRLGELGQGSEDENGWARQFADGMNISDGVLIVAPSRAYSRSLVDDTVLTEDVQVAKGGSGIGHSRNPDATRLMTLTDSIVVTAGTASEGIPMGFYMSNATEDTGISELGVPEISSTYYQPQQQQLNLTKERARYDRGTQSTNISITGKGTQRWAGIANGVQADLDWLDQYVAALNTLSEYKNIKVYACIDQEWEVKVNQGAITGESADPAKFGEAQSIFFEKLAANAPKVISVYWCGGFDTAKIAAVLQATRVAPKIIAVDPYLNGNETGTFYSCIMGYLDKFRVAGVAPTIHTEYVRLGRPKMAIAEHGIQTGDGGGTTTNHTPTQIANYFIGMRAQARDADVAWHIFFNSDAAKPHVITTGGLFPNAQACINYKASQQDTTGSTLSSVSSAVTTVADPDTSSGPALVFENSGMVMSRKNSSLANGRVFYAVNDQNYSGATNGSFFAFDDKSPYTVLGEYKLGGISSSAQFEELCWGPGPISTTHYLYICRLGSGASSRTIYRVAEPNVSPNQLQVSQTIASGSVEAFTFASFPVSDCEGAFVDPITGDFYFFEKRTTAQRPFASEVYRVPASQFVAGGGPLTATLVGSVRSHTNTINDAGITAADISRNGEVFGYCNLQEMWLWRRPDTSVSIASILQASPTGHVYQSYPPNPTTSDWGSETMAMDMLNDFPTRIWQHKEGPGSTLGYVTATYS